MSTAKPWPTTLPVIVTRVFGGENAVAFSTSSAIRWMTSFTAVPATASADSVITSTRT